MKKIIILDIGNTLFMFNRNIVAKKFSKINNFSINKNLKLLSINHKNLMLGKITQTKFAKEKIKLLKLKLTVKEFNKIYSNVFVKINFKLLKLIKNKEVIILSDTEKIVISSLKDKYKNILINFKYKIFSYDINCLKSSKKPFKYIIKKFKIKPKNLIFIDDRIENIKVAKELGINSIRYNGTKTFYKKLKRKLRNEN